MSDGTDFWVVLDPPPYENHYVTNSDVTGAVVVVADKDEPDYKFIEVSLKGHAWAAVDSNIRYSETYAVEVIVVWSKASSGNQFTSGSHTFPFSLKFGQFSGPPSFSGSSGAIHYEVQARITGRYEAVKFSEPVSINYVPFFDLNLIPEVLKPKTIQIYKTSLCWCASGPISLTARIPRTGFCCTGVDAIPLEVDIENGSNRQIRYIEAKLKRLVTYTNREGQHCVDKDKETIAVIKSDTAIHAGRSLTWKPSPFSIPKMDYTSITTCNNIKLKYYLKVEAVVFGSSNPYVKFDLLLGNVPIEATQHTVQPCSVPQTD